MPLAQNTTRCLAFSHRSAGSDRSCAVLQAKDIADEVECADLAAAIGEQLVAPHRAFDHLVDIFRWLGLAKNFRTPAIFELAQYDLCAAS